jgi:bifunctional non-homologous end joining protein LigD
MPLDEYHAKRDFSHTPEPDGGTPSAAGTLSFVVQKHHARALHYDFRLELDGVLMSWAVPKGPSLDPHDKRLAMHVEDHPLDYGGFEGTIPAGEYGAGSVIVWDRGTWEPLGDPHAGMAKGDFKFTLHGEKLRGLWVLVRLKPRPGERRESWLLIKEKDEFVRPAESYNLLAEEPLSVISGVDVEDAGKAGAVGGAGGDGFSAQAGGNPDAGTSASIPAAPSDGARVTSRAAVASAFPDSVDIQLATLVDGVPEGDEWVAEAKYDGYRVVMTLDLGRARAFTRSHADWSERFSGLVHAVEELPASSAIIDGEAVIFDDAGVSRFELLQRGLSEHPERVAFAAFDLQYLNGYDLRELPLLQRKELLRELLGGLGGTSPLRYADHVAGSAAGEFFRAACLSDLEGVVCKKADSRYTPGRNRDWVKIKCRQSQELVVGGFTEGAGSRAALGSVLVGTYDGDRLVYAGRVGSGLDESTVGSLRARLEAIEQPAPAFDPPPHISGHVIHWTQPTVVIEAAFREWTSEGVLRQPVFLGLREDKSPSEVVRERPEAPASAVAGAGAGSLAAAEPARSEPGVDAAAGATEPSPGAAPHTPDPAPNAASPSAPAAGPASVLGIKVTNPDKLLFPDSPGFPKLSLARYYDAVAPIMLAEIAERPLTLVRCPVGHGRNCFYQRHPDAGLPKQVSRFAHAIKHEEFEFLFVDSAEGLIALAQMGVGEIHTWLSRVDEPRRPDRICFDLDPGPSVTWPQICSAARLVAEAVDALGFTAYVKSTGSKGLHVVLPIEPVWEFERVRALSKAVVDQLVARHPEALVGKMAKDAREGRIFFDYLRNAEGASAVAPYSTRMKPGPSCAVPLAWDELTDDLDIHAFTPPRVIERVASGIDPWRSLAENPAGVRVLKSAESALAE